MMQVYKLQVFLVPSVLDPGVLAPGVLAPGVLAPGVLAPGVAWTLCTYVLGVQAPCTFIQAAKQQVIGFQPPGSSYQD